ncbi:MAG: hypothetical protein NTY65_14885, partial [Planctomycetota bacterium]|nr:hypothetical protein [Planctomycetota bacterium]
WTAGGGRLVLRLSGLKAESNVYGWYVRAARGRLTLEGPSPMETLAALNQRLIQPEGSPRLMSLVVERLDVRLNAGDRILRTEVLALALSHATAYDVTAFSLDAFKGPSSEPPPPLVSLRLNPASERGLFEYVKADFKGLPLGRPARKTAGVSTADFVTGILDLDADYSAAASPASAAKARAVFHDLDLAAWTKKMPGGPLTGTGTLTLAYERKARGPEELSVDLESSGGSMTPAMLEWLETLPANLRAAKTAGPAAVEFDRLAVRCRIIGHRGWFEGPADPIIGVPLATSGLLGVDLPIVRASEQPFDAREVWPPLAKALGFECEAEGPGSKK